MLSSWVRVMIVCESRCADVCLHMCMLTLVYLHVSAGACAHTYICVHRKVVDLGCLPQLLSTPVFERGSLIEPGAHKFNSAGCPASLRDPVSLHSQNWD